ncbi:MAG: hypothetical protein AAFU85_14165 [Planctomycetota bacterium]
MHERTQRAVARLLFVFCCAVPTGLVAASVVITWTPWYRSYRLAQLEHTLQQETGLAIAVERCRELAPDKFKLENVELRDPESGQLVATIGTIDWLNEDTSTRVVLHSPILRSAALGDAWQLIHDRLIRRPQHTLKPLVVVADRLTIRSSGTSITHDVEVYVEAEEQGVQMHVRASDELDEDSMLQCTLFRNREGRRPMTEVSLSTGTTPLPCSVLEDYFPVLRRLGPDARFRGTMEFRQLPDQGWSYNFDGTTVTGISLSRVSESLPYHVSGTAAVYMPRCSIIPGQKVNVSAEVSVPEGGWTDWDLLQDFSKQKEMGLGLNSRVGVSADRKVQYSKASFSVTITNERMALQGLCTQGEDYTYEGPIHNIALCHFSQPLAQTSKWDFSSDLVTALFSPPRGELGYWNAVLLPSPKPVRVATAPDETESPESPAAAHR